MRGWMSLAGVVLVLTAGMTLAGCEGGDTAASSPGAEKQDAGPAASPQADAGDPEGAFAFSAQSIEGEGVDLSQYQGKVLLIVNVASRCGNTPQYADLEKLYEDRKAQGLVVLGFPANDFGSQEPGTNEQIRQFCTSKYGVSFPMFAKITVKGEGQHPLYAWLTDQEKHPDTGGAIRWNFDKFLIGRDGKVLARFSPRTNPSSQEVVKQIEAALGRQG